MKSELPPGLEHSPRRGYAEGRVQASRPLHAIGMFVEKINTHRMIAYTQGAPGVNLRLEMFLKRRYVCIYLFLDF